MSLLVLGVYLLDKVCGYLPLQDLSNLEMTCKTLYFQVEEVGVWKSKFLALSRKYQYGFVLDTSKQLHLVEPKFYKLLTGLVIIMNRSVMKYFQCCFWEERYLDQMNQGSAESSDVADADEISVKELLFTRGDSIVLRNGHFVVEDSDFPGLGLKNPLKIPLEVAANISGFLSCFTAWLEEYFKYIEGFIDVLREQVFLFH